MASLTTIAADKPPKPQFSPVRAELLLPPPPLLPAIGQGGAKLPSTSAPIPGRRVHRQAADGRPKLRCSRYFELGHILALLAFLDQPTLFDLRESEHGNPKLSLITMLTSDPAKDALFRCGAFVALGAPTSQLLTSHRLRSWPTFALRTASTLSDMSRLVRWCSCIILGGHGCQ